MFAREWISNVYGQKPVWEMSEHLIKKQAQTIPWQLQSGWLSNNSIKLSISKSNFINLEKKKVWSLILHRQVKQMKLDILKGQIIPTVVKSSSVQRVGKPHALICMRYACKYSGNYRYPIYPETLFPHNFFPTCLHTLLQDQ